jgi:hypothetical protein
MRGKDHPAHADGAAGFVAMARRSDLFAAPTPAASGGGGGLEPLGATALAGLDEMFKWSVS